MMEPVPRKPDTRGGDRHDVPLIGLRLPGPKTDEDLYGRLMAYLERTGQSKNAVVTQAVREYLDRAEDKGG